MIYVKYNGKRRFYYWFLLPILVVDMILLGGTIEIVRVVRTDRDAQESQ